MPHEEAPRLSTISEHTSDAQQIQLTTLNSSESPVDVEAQNCENEDLEEAAAAAADIRPEPIRPIAIMRTRFDSGIDDDVFEASASVRSSVDQISNEAESDTQNQQTAETGGNFPNSPRFYLPKSMTNLPDSQEAQAGMDASNPGYQNI